MQDITLNNCERQKRWERIQVKLFKIGLKGLRIGQIQQSGSVFFTQTTHILIYYIAAKSVVEGSMTLGMMMSLTYIIGQVSAPIGEFYGILSIFLLEFIIPKFQQKRRDLFSIDHTHHIRQEEYDGKEGQHDNGRAPDKMLIWSKDERHQQGKEKPCGCYDRAVFGKPFVDDGVIQEEDSLTSTIHANKEKKENTKPSVFASMRKAITANIVNDIAAVNVRAEA